LAKRLNRANRLLCQLTEREAILPESNQMPLLDGLTSIRTATHHNQQQRQIAISLIAISINELSPIDNQTTKLRAVFSHQISRTTL